jgi:DNA adenine methylase
VRYHGGKWKLAPWIISHFPPHRIYVEPYGGAGSVLLQKPRSYAEIYNDLEGEIVNLFRVLRDRKSARELERFLRLTPFAREEFEAAYPDKVRTGSSSDRVASLNTRIERARRLIVRGYQGFSSAAINPRHHTGFRSSSHRSGTTPASDWAHFPNSLALITERLQGVCVERQPASRVMLAHDSPRTLHYVDPPYLLTTRKVHQRSAYQHEMSDRQHSNLANLLVELKGMVVVSGYASDLYDCSLFSGWMRIENKVHAGVRQGQSARTEVLWLNKRAEAGLSQPNLFKNSGGGG